MGSGGRSSVKIATGIGTRPIKTGRDLGGRYRRAVVENHNKISASETVRDRRGCYPSLCSSNDTYG